MANNKTDYVLRVPSWPAHQQYVGFQIYGNPTKGWKTTWYPTGLNSVTPARFDSEADALRCVHLWAVSAKPLPADVVVHSVVEHQQ